LQLRGGGRTPCRMRWSRGGCQQKWVALRPRTTSWKGASPKRGSPRVKMLRRNRRVAIFITNVRARRTRSRITWPFRNNCWRNVDASLTSLSIDGNVRRRRSNVATSERSTSEHDWHSRDYVDWWITRDQSRDTERRHDCKRCWAMLGLRRTLSFR